MERVKYQSVEKYDVLSEANSVGHSSISDDNGRNQKQVPNSSTVMGQTRKVENPQDRTIKKRTSSKSRERGTPIIKPFAQRSSSLAKESQRFE
jgi:hypothetical protein